MIEKMVEIHDEFKTRKLRILRLSGLLLVGLFGLFSFLVEKESFEFSDCHAVLAQARITDYRDCQWTITDQGYDDWTISLVVDGQEIARNTVGPIEVFGIPEFEDAPYQKGWGASIVVAKELNNRGLGEVLWQAGDNFIAARFGKGQVRIYIDAANTNHFAKKIIKKVKPIYSNRDGDFIYIIGE